MVDVKISALSAISAVAAEDLIAIIDDPTGTPASRKATFTQILAFIDANSSALNNIVEDTSPQLGADLDANGFDINIDAGLLLTFDTGTQAQKIVGDAGGLTSTVPTGDTHDFIVNATNVVAIAETGVTLTGTLAVSGILDTLDIETATVSARDGSLAITIADSTGVPTFVSGAVLVAPVLGTPASGNLGSCTAYPGDSSLVTVGTIATGVWNGTAVASAYLDSDTQHLSVAQTVSGVKTYSANTIHQDTLKAMFGTGSDSSIVDTGSGMLIDFDEANAGSKTLVIESDATAILTVSDTAITTSVGVDIAGTNLDNIQKTIYDITAITSSTTIAIDFATDDLNTLALAHNTTFSTSNLAAGQQMEIHITSAAAYTMAFPATWTFYGDKPTTTTAGKDSILYLTSLSTTDASVKAVFVEEA